MMEFCKFLHSHFCHRTIVKIRDTFLFDSRLNRSATCPSSGQGGIRTPRIAVYYLFVLLNVSLKFGGKGWN